MLGAVFQTVAQRFRESFVRVWGLAALDGACDGVRDDTAFFGFDEQFGAGAYELEAAAIDVEEIGAGVDGSEVAVEIEGVEGCGAREALGGDGLDDVAAGDVRFESTDMCFVACLADVGRVLLIRSDGRLFWERDFGT